MGGVDKNDAMVGNYSYVRKTYKWTTKVFFQFLEEAIFNSFLLYSKNNTKNVYGSLLLAAVAKPVILGILFSVSPILAL